MKVARCIAGFILVVVGIGTLGAQVAFLGIHPVVWFILGAALLLGDSAWERLARKGDAQSEAQAGSPGEMRGEAEAAEREGAVSKEAAQEDTVPESTAGRDEHDAAQDGAACYNPHPENEAHEN